MMPPRGVASRFISSIGPRALLLLVGLAYLASRVFNLLGLPIFFDEAIHLIWAHGLKDVDGALAAWRLGKLLHIAATAVTTGLVSTPLWAARLTTVVTGLVTLWAVYRIGRHLDGERLGLLAGLLYVVCPFTLLHDRLNLADPYAACFTALALLATLGLWHDPRWARGLGLGLALIGATLAKATGALALTYPVAAVVLLGLPGRRLGRVLAVSVVPSAGVCLVLLGAFVATSGEVGAKGYLGGGDWLELLAHNTTLAAGWLLGYWTPPLVLLAAVGCANAWIRQRPADRLLVAALGVQVLTFVVMASTWFPRYLLPATAPALVLAARGLWDIVDRLVRAERLRAGAGVLLATLALVPALGLDRAIIREPERARLPPADRVGFVTGWSSGYGWREAYEYLAREHQREGVALGVLIEPHNPTLAALFLGSPGVRIRPLDLDSRAARALARKWVRRRRTYVVVASPGYRGFAEAGIRSEHVAGFTKPGRQFSINVYRLSPEDGGD